MDWQLYFAFVAATAILMLIPGPNVALIVANSLARGTRVGLLTVAGTSCAMVPQLLLVLLGMSAALTVLSDWFAWLRWIGVAYLVYLGIKQWRTPADDLLGVRAEQESNRAIFARGFLVSLTNPKTLLFYGAFFPQFIDPHHEAMPQFAILSATFLTLAVLLDSSWAMLAGHTRPLLQTRATLRNRLSGSLLLGAALGLALARKK
jgi:threonine/homoserine/homoserine lactone efflux protein